MRALAILIAANSAWGCVCSGTVDVCAVAADQSAVVFVARVLSRDAVGLGPIRVAIEEPLRNVPPGQSEAELHVAAGTSCHARLEWNERYLIITKAGTYSINQCSAYFQVRYYPYILEALRNQVSGGPARLVGRVRATASPVAFGEMAQGAIVSAERDGRRFEAATGGSGEYEILGLDPGPYTIAVSFPGHMLASDGSEVVELRKAVCKVKDLVMWPAGRISGGVTDAARKPAGGINIGAFAITDGRRDAVPLRSTKTASDGTYVLAPLVPGKYVVGVNAQEHVDQGVHPTALHRGGTPVDLAAGAAVAGVDIVLDPPRTTATLRVRVVGPDGNPLAGARVRAYLQDERGVGDGDLKTDASGSVSFTVFTGQRVEVRAFYGPGSSWSGQAGIDVKEREHSVVVTLRKPNWMK
jgi:hypothetical protein